MAKFYLQIDGQNIEIPEATNSLRIIAEDEWIPGIQIHFNFTHEAVITDVVSSKTGEVVHEDGRHSWRDYQDFLDDETYYAMDTHEDCEVKDNE